MSSDFALGCVTLVLAAAYYAAATLLPQSQLDDAVGPQGLPKIYAVVLAVLSLVLIMKSVGGRGQGAGGGGKGAGGKGAGGKKTERPALGRVAGMLAIGVVYIVAAPWVGYIPALAALILATTYYQGGVINRYVAVVAVTGALLFWVLFVFVLGIPQPSGFWPSPY